MKDLIFFLELFLLIAILIFLKEHENELWQEQRSLESAMQILQSPKDNDAIKRLKKFQPSTPPATIIQTSNTKESRPYFLLRCSHGFIYEHSIYNIILQTLKF